LLHFLYVETIPASAMAKLYVVTFAACMKCSDEVAFRAGIHGLLEKAPSKPLLCLALLFARHGDGCLKGWADAAAAVRFLGWSR
jgi:hypothetical protein